MIKICKKVLKKHFTRSFKINRIKIVMTLKIKVREALKTRVALSRPVCGQNKDHTCGPWILDLENEHDFSSPEERPKPLCLS